MTNDQKQKVMQLLELCIDNNKDGEYACTFDAYPSNQGSVSVSVYIGKERGGFDETYSMCLDATYTNDNAKLDAAIEAIRTLPERATTLIAAKEAARREKLLKEYEEVFGKNN